VIWEEGALGEHSSRHPGFPSEQCRDPSRSDGRTDVFAGSSLRQIVPLSLTAEDDRVCYYISGSLHGFGCNDVVKMIPTPLDEGWGVSSPVGNGPKSG